MFNRRSLLRATAIATLLPLLSSCGNRREAFRVLLLADSIPPQLLRTFRSSLGGEVALDFTAEPKLQALFKFLQTWKEGESSTESESRWFDRLPFTGQKSPTAADLISLGHYWLSEAIEKQLIAPLDLEELAGWQKLPESMQVWVRREGRIWGAPYRWGTTAIAYNRDRFKALGRTPTDWNDLWEWEELRDRISIIDQPREVIGLVLKTLGYSYNEENPASIPELKTALKALHQHVKFYSSTTYLQPLILEDAWVAVGWSTDLVPVAQQYPNIETLVPRSGTALWADLWVKPSVSRSDRVSQSVIDNWIDFCWQEQTARQISRFTTATSPILLSLDRATLAAIAQKNPLALPEAETIDRSEFILPLSPESQQQYKALWKEIRAIN